MTVCIIAEGCYPYVVGGVSSWIHSIIKLFPNIEFKLISIISDRSSSGKFVYQLPGNLTEVHEVYLQDADWVGGKKAGRGRLHLKKKEVDALRSLIIGEEVDWPTVFRIFDRKDISINHILMSPEFLEITKEYYSMRFSDITFSDFLWTLRSMYLPLFFALRCAVPRADVYHCVSTGYAGVIGSKAYTTYPDSRLLISEHGIYTREREEEIIKAKWVRGIYKSIWIEQFRKMSKCAYHYADLVTALFEQAHSLQLELGCPANKAVITPNGIDVSRFSDLPGKDPEDPYINVGAILRVTPIKDVKTMINAFHFAHQKEPRLKLWIMGPDDEDPEYAADCRELVKTLQAENIEFTGSIRTADYIGRMDMTILTSISEGQPLTILEGFAAKKPCIATNVGNCHGLVYGENDSFGEAGIVVPIMNISEISRAILRLARHPETARRMGENGYQRLMHKYQSVYMEEAYRRIYKALAEISEVEYREEPFVPQI
ncbi:glycosyltransferase involved in cell wall biosynthesis [Anaerotaenia torta]|uniref:GT4 family glycosyltransferase PelF n=1 Tax=Anaerotaenia torta TaxID=433293 RepID=UPI003D250F0F